ncbi:30S ribosomal protein S21 [Strawberry lethal yellows phytoplasma (CPA) str. NZSb11]|nr:30S ribosomal protein S21 [Strawberry lethal yellows phytoplasma (CPA) str. NZSb11]
MICLFLAFLKIINLIIEGGEKLMSKIFLRKGETIDETLRRFKREVAKNGVLAEARRKEHYIKPSVQRKNLQKSMRGKRR